MIIDYKLPALPATGIVFGQWRFSEPEPLPASAGLVGFLQHEGVYAILIDDLACRPRPFRAVYFGEAEDLWSRATQTHENFAAWRREVGLFGRLYRAFHAMPGSTQVYRQMIESALIDAYKPVCNKRLSFSLFAGK
jgi:hypothetical protein